MLNITIPREVLATITFAAKRMSVAYTSGTITYRLGHS